jgi:hypothetical protein
VSHWDKVIIALVAIYGAALSTLTAFHAWRKNKADKQASATALQQQIQSSEKAHKIMAKSALLASYNTFQTIMENENIFLRTQGRRGSQHATSGLRNKIEALERDLETLTKTED